MTCKSGMMIAGGLLAVYGTTRLAQDAWEYARPTQADHYDLIISYPDPERGAAPGSLAPAMVGIRRASDAQILFDAYISDSAGGPAITSLYRTPELANILGGELSITFIGRPRP